VIGRLLLLSTAFLAAGYRSWWDWLKERDWLWATFPAIPGAIGGVKTLRAQGHYVEMVTSKPVWAEPQVWRWLGKWRPPFNAVTIVSSTQKQSKVDYTKADIIIDDKRQTCEDFVKAGRRAIHYDHVGDSYWMPNLYTVSNWADAVSTIRAIEEVHAYATN